MHRKALLLVPVVLIASVSLTGCFTDRVTDKISGKLNGEEFAAKFVELNNQADEAGSEFGQVVGDAKPGAPMSDQVRTVATESFEGLRDVADELDDLNPPDDAEDAVDALVEATNDQVDAALEVIEQDGSTPGDLFAALEAADPTDPAIDELKQLGYAPADA